MQVPFIVNNKNSFVANAILCVPTLQRVHVNKYIFKNNKNNNESFRNASIVKAKYILFRENEN